MTALIAGGMLVTGLAVPAAAQEPEPVGGQATCLDDPANDVRERQGTQPADSDPEVDEPRADITRFCVTAGPEASFHVSISQPTDPAEDANWHNATFLGWYVDTEDDGFFIDFSLDREGSELSANTATITREGGSDADEVTCTVPAQITATGYAISGVTPDCFDDAATVTAQPAMYYDADGEGGEGVAYDLADEQLGGRDITADRTVRRLDGENRTHTSVLISREEFSVGEAETVYLARSDVFADAAVGGVLTDGPILIVPSCDDVPEVVIEEIERLDVDVVTALGGTTAICEPMLEAAAAATGTTTDRIGGETRFHTSAEIARTAFDGSTDRVYLARSDMFIDAVAGGTLTDGPILLVPQCGDVPDVIEAAIDEFDPDTVVGLGGTVAICEPTLDEAADGRATTRIAGENRYGTAIQIAQHVFPEPTARDVYLARADLVVDALAAGVLTDGPVLVIDSCGDWDDDRMQPVGVEISRNAPEDIVGLGGELAICDDTLEQAGEF